MKRSILLSLFRRAGQEGLNHKDNQTASHFSFYHRIHRLTNVTNWFNFQITIWFNFHPHNMNNYILKKNITINNHSIRTSTFYTQVKQKKKKLTIALHYIENGTIISSWFVAITMLLIRIVLHYIVLNIKIKLVSIYLKLIQCSK